MARGRMISKSISLDEKVNSLPDDTARLLFTWLIPHLDCEGRQHGDPVTIKSIVFPRRNISIRKIEKYLKEMEKKRLILRYSVDGNAYLFAPNFEKHQTGLQKSKEAQSQIPPPPPDLIPELLQSKVGFSLLQVKDQVKVKVKDQYNNSSRKNLAEIYEQNIGVITPMIAEELKMLSEEFSLEWFTEAIKEACGQNKRNLKYVKAILERWKVDGLKVDTRGKGKGEKGAPDWMRKGLKERNNADSTI